MTDATSPSTPKRITSTDYVTRLQLGIEALEREKVKLLAKFQGVGIEDAYKLIAMEYGCLPPNEVVIKLGLDACDAKTDELLRDVKAAIAMNNNVPKVSLEQATTTFLHKPPLGWEYGISDRQPSWLALSPVERASYLAIDLRRCAKYRLQTIKNASLASWDHLWARRINRVREIDLELTPRG